MASLSGAFCGTAVFVCFGSVIAVLKLPRMDILLGRDLVKYSKSQMPIG